MASPRFMMTNLIDTATIVPSTEDAALPASNVANALRTKVWRSGATLDIEYLVIDHGSAKAITCVVLFAHNLTSGDPLLQIQGNNTDVWGAPSFNVNLTYATGPIVAYFAQQTYRYTRIVYQKSAPGETRDIGRIFLGTYFENPVAENITINTVDLTKSTTTIGGQHYSDVRNNYDDITIPMSLITKADKDTLKPLFVANGTHTPFFISINDDVEPVDWVYYVKNKKIPGFAAVSSTNYWSTELSMREQL